MKRFLFTIGTTVAIASPSAFSAQAQAGPTPEPMPITAVAPGRAGTQLVMMVTGEAGLTEFEEALAQALATTGDGVLLLDSREYLRAARSPAQVASAASATIQRYAQTWNRQRLVLVGYSRGADVAPFIANRLSKPVRETLDGLVMISPSGRASFELTLRDVVRLRPRATDLPVMPELERLRGTRLVCDYGGNERAAFCTRVDSTLARPVVRSGGHDLHAADGAQIARLITELVRP